MSRKVDIHADDYGYSISTSKDILKCIKAGKLDSISVMSNMFAFKESMDMLFDAIEELPFLPAMSVHLNIPEGFDENGYFPMSWGKLFLSSYSFKRKEVKNELKRYLKKQIDDAQIEIERCIEKAKECNIECAQKGIRLDSHIHTHLIPVVWDSLIEIIEEEKYNIEYIRNPKEPLLPFIKHISLYRTFSPVNLIKNRILMFYSGRVDRYCEKNGFEKMYMWGLMMSGNMDYDRIRTLYPDMAETARKKNRKLELLFHPGKASEDEFGKDTDPDYFKEANLSDNRHVEKYAVMNIDEIVM